jgi:hypothetical protein
MDIKTLAQEVQALKKRIAALEAAPLFKKLPSPIPTVGPVAGETRVWEKDGSMVVYIPPGEFPMGLSLCLPGRLLDRQVPGDPRSVSKMR